MIDVRSVSFAWDASMASGRVSGLSFRVEAGEILAVVGPSGCGKTTLLRLLSGYLAPDEGSVLIAGRPAHERAVSVGMCFQGVGLVPWRTVLENIRLASEIAGSSSGSGAREEELIEVCRLRDHLRRLPRQLSGGIGERSALARALMARPKLLLLDEPLGSTDFLHRLELEDFVHAYVRREGASCVCVTHDFEQALAVGDRVLVMPMSGSGRHAEMVECPRHLAQLPPSKARVDDDARGWLSRLMALYRRLATV